MPIYSYRGLSPEGKKIAGVIDADTLAAAKERLKARGSFITFITLERGSKNACGISSCALIAFTREVHQLLRAGLPLYESFVTIEEKMRKNKVHPLMISLCDHIKSGKSLSFALSEHPRIFDPIYLATIKAAEQSGALAAAFLSLYELLEKRRKLSKQLKSSLAYPSFLALFCLILIFFLLFFIVPSMQELFEGRPLHPITSSVLAVSRFMKEHTFIVFSLLLTPSAVLVVFFKSAKAKAALFSFALRLPLVGRALSLSSLVRFFRSMHLLLRGGIPLYDSLSFARKAMQHSYLESVVQEAEKGLIEGRKLSTLFTHNAMPPLVARMLSIAEQTGSLSSCMESLAQIFEEDLDKDLSQLSTFLQPAVLLVLGIIIGIVVLSILLPLTDVSSFIST